MNSREQLKEELSVRFDRVVDHKDGVQVIATNFYTVRDLSFLLGRAPIALRMAAATATETIVTSVLVRDNYVALTIRQELEPSPIST